MAEASGLTLVPPDQCNPEVTTSYGTGQLLRHAETQGAKLIQLAIGGSATNDAGLGLLMALGWQFLDKADQSVGWGGQALAKVGKIVPPSMPFNPDVTVLCDVTNPFYGSQGAAFTYGPQKGADYLMVKRLDDGLRHFADHLWQEFQVDLNFPGAGAAGGMGGGVVWGLNAQLKSGFSAIAELTKLEAAIQQCDGVITGEGCFDHQSLQGKVVGGVIELAQKYQKPVFVVAGQTKLTTHPAIAYLGSLVGKDLNLEQSLAHPQRSLMNQMALLQKFLKTYGFNT
jgi:glycerate kinase